MQRFEGKTVIVTGGELNLAMLDLKYNPVGKFYEAPLQMKANGGTFLIDDFGRQRIPARDLLNRWIVPAVLFWLATSVALAALVRNEEGRAQVWFALALTAVSAKKPLR